MQYAHAYYAAQALNLVDKTHAAVYDAVHTKHTLPAEGQKPDEEKIAAFYAGYGASQADFLSTMKSFGVDVKVRRATVHDAREGPRDADADRQRPLSRQRAARTKRRSRSRAR